MEKKCGGNNYDDNNRLQDRLLVIIMAQQYHFPLSSLFKAWLEKLHQSSPPLKIKSVNIQKNKNKITFHTLYLPLKLFSMLLNTSRQRKNKRKNFPNICCIKETKQNKNSVTFQLYIKHVSNAFKEIYNRVKQQWSIEQFKHKTFDQNLKWL